MCPGGESATRRRRGRTPRRPQRPSAVTDGQRCARAVGRRQTWRQRGSWQGQSGLQPCRPGQVGRGGKAAVAARSLTMASEESRETPIVAASTAPGYEVGKLDPGRL
jgi:hypothetical protein